MKQAGGKEKLVDTKLLRWGYAGGACYEHNHSSVNEFFINFNDVPNSTMAMSTNNLSGSTAMPGVYLPNELEELLSGYGTYEYRWCGRTIQMLVKKDYDWDRDVTHVSSTEFKNDSIL